MKKSQLLGTVCATYWLLIICISSAHAAAVSGQGTWDSTLQGRDLDGIAATFEAYYDTVLDITWLADTNHAKTSGFHNTGQMDWSTANAWAASLDPYGSGIIGWRLPDTNPIDGRSISISLSFNGTEDLGDNISAPSTLFAGSTASEMAYMYYNTLGNLAFCDPVLSTSTSCSGPQSGFGLSYNRGPFTNLQTSIYWSGTEFVHITTTALYFLFSSGSQSIRDKDSSFFAWAVHSGEVGVPTIPVPSAVWLFGSGLICLIGTARRKK